MKKIQIYLPFILKKIKNDQISSNEYRITSDLKLYGLATLFYISIGPLKLVLGA